MPENSVRPGKRPSRASASPARVPSTSATVDETTATFSVIQAASSNRAFSTIATYHLVENPAQTVTSFDSLKE